MGRATVRESIIAALIGNLFTKKVEKINNMLKTILTRECVIHNATVTSVAYKGKFYSIRRFDKNTGLFQPVNDRPMITKTISESSKPALLEYMDAAAELNSAVVEANMVLINLITMVNHIADFRKVLPESLHKYVDNIDVSAFEKDSARRLKEKDLEMLYQLFTEKLEELQILQMENLLITE
jgi:hypothetical protein